MELTIVDHIDGNAVRVAEFDGETAEAARAALAKAGLIEDSWLYLKTVDGEEFVRSEDIVLARDLKEAARWIDGGGAFKPFAETIANIEFHHEHIVLDWARE